MDFGLWILGRCEDNNGESFALKSIYCGRALYELMRQGFENKNMS
jgi:hypothetical protein